MSNYPRNKELSLYDKGDLVKAVYDCVGLVSEMIDFDFQIGSQFIVKKKHAGVATILGNNTAPCVFLTYLSTNGVDWFQTTNTTLTVGTPISNTTQMAFTKYVVSASVSGSKIIWSN